MAEALESTLPSGRARSTVGELPIIGGGLGLALVAALAARFGVPQAQPLVGAIVILGIAYVCSTDRRAIDFRTVAWGLGLQVLFALVVLKTGAGQQAFSALGGWITQLLNFAFVGSAFVFGPLGDAAQWQKLSAPLGPAGASLPVAFLVAPTIIFVAALFAILYYFGVMQLVVRLFAVLMHRVL